jgi:hypothetical protein
MILIGLDFLQAKLAEQGFAAKAVLNGKGAIFFPVSQEHRDQKAPGISYADEYQGNALAAMLSPGKIEIRNHRDFSESRVEAIMSALFKLPELTLMRSWQVTYRGNELSVG